LKSFQVKSIDTTEGNIGEMSFKEGIEKLHDKKITKNGSENRSP